MSKLQNCCQALSCAVAISIVSAVAPAVAADFIEISAKNLGVPPGTLMKIAELERFAQTGDPNDLPTSPNNSEALLEHLYKYTPEIYDYYDVKKLGFKDFVKDLQKQLNRPIDVESGSPLDPRETWLFELMGVSKSEQRKGLKFMAENAQGQILIDFLKTVPVDTITDNNFLSILRAYPDQPKASNPTPIDLRTWRQEGSPASGHWVVSEDGNSVVQTINGTPTFFVSPEEFINTNITGKFGVEDYFDDDFIGFVFGYQSPITANNDLTNDFNFFLFDWTRGNQGVGIEGFSLDRVNGRFDYQEVVNGFSVHQDNPPKFDVLATSYGSGKGWKGYTEYDFSLIYETDRIKIDIDGETIFDLRGEFESGRFGFYNYSQSFVRYSGLGSEPVPEPSAVASLALLGMVGLGKVAWRKRKGA